MFSAVSSTLLDSIGSVQKKKWLRARFAKKRKLLTAPKVWASLILCLAGLQTSRAGAPIFPDPLIQTPHGLSEHGVNFTPEGGKSFSKSKATIIRILPVKDIEFAVQDVEGPPGLTLPLGITLPAETSKGYTFLVIRGLPLTFALSAGLRTKDAWVISAADVENLRLITPPNVEGSYKVELQLNQGKDLPPQTASITITLSNAVGTRAAEGKPQVGTSAPIAVSIEPLAHVELTPEESEIMRHAETLLRTKDVAGTRLLYARLAKLGNAQGAFLMGRTFDPKFLGLVPTAGIAADSEQAKQWYSKAKEMGSEDAARRLKELDGK